MNLHDFHFDLPEELIGQKAIEPRDSCKLLVVNRESQSLTHHIFRDILTLLDKNYVFVVNDTKVFPARLFGTKDTGGKVEVLLLKQIALDSYQAMGRGKLKIGQKLDFGSGLSAILTSKDETGEIVIKFNLSGTDLISKIDELGRTPLPPYIHSETKEKDLREQYQTVYAREKGSAAAPTAGLHFTPELMKNLIEKGVAIEKITLHVGLGTFKPVTEEQINSQTLHTESFFVTDEVVKRLNDAKKEGKKIIAVGTTTCRVLETQTNQEGIIRAGEGETSIFIQPGYKYKFVDGLITNFHLPETSLLMLVSTLVSSPNSSHPFKNFADSLIGKAYQEAIKNKYKFFSFGDAMLIL
jgi:S-adenosylmethionine:tRNA ribosyltransferase-isomerase